MIFKVAQIVPSAGETKGLHDIRAEDKRPAIKVQTSLFDVEIYYSKQQDWYTCFILYHIYTSNIFHETENKSQIVVAT